MNVIATDLDRTLIPDGDSPVDPNAMDEFKRLLKLHHTILIFVTGRNLPLICEALKEYDLPGPDFVLANLGTEIYSVQEEQFLKDDSWELALNNSWHGINSQEMKQWFSHIKELSLQEDEKNNNHKLSYYFPEEADEHKIADKVKSILKEKNLEAEVITSIDTQAHKGLLDIVPSIATKIAALEHLAKQLGVHYHELLYAGDSGNDILALTSGLQAVVVANARKEIKNEVHKIMLQKGLEKKVFFARGEGSEGNYVSGIIQGAKHFGLF